MNIALVYDRVNKVGGAERILSALHELYPRAPLFTSVYNKEKAPWAKDFIIESSFVDKIQILRNHHELLPWIMSTAFESFPFDRYDVVVSITSAEAKGIITKPGTLHICYCLTPTRYLWSGINEYSNNPGTGIFNALASKIFPLVSSYLRTEDYILSARPDRYAAISNTVAKRIKKYYGKKATVIYPPIDCDMFTIGTDKKDDFFLVVSRLVPYKHIEIIIDAFNTFGKKLIIIGSGHEEKNLKRWAKENITFLNSLSDVEMKDYYRRSQALISASDEDFGITSLEAQACGTPVLAYGKGGYKETVIPGKTGDFYDEQSKDSLLILLKRFNPRDYSPLECRQNALRFSKERFKDQFQAFVEGKRVRVYLSHSK